MMDLQRGSILFLVGTAHLAMRGERVARRALDAVAPPLPQARTKCVGEDSRGL